MGNKTAVIILAAGLGKRMESAKAKVLHEVLGKPMILYVLETAMGIAGNNLIVVVGYQAEIVRQKVSEVFEVEFAYQAEQLGTAHAVSCAIPHLPENMENILILCGDVPLISHNTLKNLFEYHIETERDISVLAVNVDDPTGYGRIIMDESGNVSGITEEADATDDEKSIKTINSGIYCVRKEYLLKTINKIKADNVQEEYYLTDIISIAYNEKKSVGAVVGQCQKEIIGVNSLQDLKMAENFMQDLASEECKTR
ncbi:MAG: NTP transferase domain-containing protein [Deltaproteobacteria bacterium]|nr:NTP transferase domain-containing protein [Deltaproteobacteria bacterium]